MSPFFGYDFIVGKPKNNVCKGRKKSKKKKKGKRMAEDGRGWRILKRIGNDDFESTSTLFRERSRFLDLNLKKCKIMFNFVGLN